MLVIDVSAAVQASLSPDGFSVLSSEELVAPALLLSGGRSVLHELGWRGTISRALADQALGRFVSHRSRPGGRSAWPRRPGGCRRARLGKDLRRRVPCARASHALPSPHAGRPAPAPRRLHCGDRGADRALNAVRPVPDPFAGAAASGDAARRHVPGTHLPPGEARRAFLGGAAALAAGGGIPRGSHAAPPPTLLVTHPVFLEHRAEGHPERPERLTVDPAGPGRRAGVAAHPTAGGERGGARARPLPGATSSASG